MITVFVGDVHEYLAVIAQSQDPTAKLVTEKNYKTFKNIIDIDT